MIPHIHRPRARRVDGSEVIAIPSASPPLTQGSSKALLSNRCLFPRSLTGRERATNNSTANTHPSTSPVEQFDQTQVLQLLDQLDTPRSSVEFATMLSQLTVTIVPPGQTVCQDTTLEESISDDESGENYDSSFIYSNLFDPMPSAENYYSTLTMTIEDPSQISLYTMTIGTVQLTSSLLAPYSILNGHRPVLEPSSETDFRRIRSKRSAHTCQVTAIDFHTANVERLRQNDIILKVSIALSQWHELAIAIEFQIHLDQSSTSMARDHRHHPTYPKEL